MKSLISMALIATLLLTSCTKTYTCACTFVDNTGKTTQETIGQMKTTKSKAQKLCDDGSNSYKSVYTSVSCHLE